MLADYLYVDRRRLDPYLEQIGQSVTYDKVPAWKAEIGLTGPKAMASQERHAREASPHEKVERLCKYLIDHDMLWRTGGRQPSTAFALERRMSVRVVVPPNPQYSDVLQNVVLWLSLPIDPNERWPRLRLLPPGTSDQPGELIFGHRMTCLLEDYMGGDQAVQDASSFSLFTIIVDGLHQSLAMKFLNHPEGRGVSVTATYPLSHNPDHMAMFTANPLRTLKLLGCKIGRPRMVRTLYRVRDIDHGEGGVFGYPIFISAVT